jgi:hypothetical protein
MIPDFTGISNSCVAEPRTGPPSQGSNVAGWLGRFFVPAGHAVELRAIFKDGKVTTGFFDHAHLDVMAEHALRLSESPGVKGVYFTLNPLKPEVLNRPGLAHQVRTAGKGDSASQADVARRRWLLLDADPRRPAPSRWRPCRGRSWSSWRARRPRRRRPCGRSPATPTKVVHLQFSG